MKNKTGIYIGFMVLSLAGLGAAFYFLTKKKGVVMQASAPTDTPETIQPETEETLVVKDNSKDITKPDSLYTLLTQGFTTSTNTDMTGGGSSAGIKK